MIDENAFGLLISYFSIEDDEYGLEPDDFVRRVREFRELVLGAIREQSPGSDVRALDLGHAIYLELADGDQSGDLLDWLRELRARLLDAEFESACVLAYGGRWVLDEEPESPFERIGADVTLLTASLPSEPLRRVLYADTASRIDEDDPGKSPTGDSPIEGWGPGLYIDSDAVEALGRSLKNAPTPLASGGALFYRAGR